MTGTRESLYKALSGERRPAAGHTKTEILKLYPYLEAEDITQALTYAAWRAEEIELPLVPA
jgi:uncharacterized protein (DUF433 family)